MPIASIVLVLARSPPPPQHTRHAPPETLSPLHPWFAPTLFCLAVDRALTGPITSAQDDPDLQSESNPKS